MNGYNPMMDYQRNQLLAQQAMIQNQLNQMNGQQPQFNPYPQSNQPQFFIRQVGSVEEARGYPVDPGTMYFFLDTGTGRIYVKKLNTNNGKSEFYIYTVQESVEGAKADPIQQINERLSNIEAIMGGLCDKSVSSNENGSKPDGNNAGANDGKVPAAGPADVPANTANGKRKE